MVAIPADMAPLTSTFSVDEPGGVLRTEVAGGASRFALDWDRGPQRFQVTLILTALKFSIWTAFYHHTVKKGAIAFEMELDSGFGAAAHSVNIMPGSYSAARTAGSLWAISFVVEAESQAYAMSASDADALVALYGQYGEQSNELLARIAQFALTDTLVLVGL